MKKKSQGKTLRRILAYTAHSGRYIVLSLVFAVISVLFSLYLPVLTGDAIDCIIEAGKVDGANKLNLFFRIELPQIAPDLCSITGSGLALNIKLMVAAEVLGATVKSIGTMLNMANYSFEVAKTLALTVVVLALGLIIEFIFNALSKKVGEWK